MSVKTEDIMSELAWTGREPGSDGYSYADYFPGVAAEYESRGEALAALRAAYLGPDVDGVGLDIDGLSLTPDTCATCGAAGYRADNADGDIVVDGAIVAHVPEGATVLALDEDSRWVCGPCYAHADWGAITSVRVTLYDCECQRCSYQWRTEDPPKRCPSCRSPYWRVPAGELPRGRPRK